MGPAMKGAPTWVPASWGGQGLEPSSCDEIVSSGGCYDKGEMLLVAGSAPPERQQQQQQHHHQGRFRRVESIIDDSDEEMEPFDAERFVDRLVEDDVEPLSWRSEMSGADGGRPHHIWEAATTNNNACSGSAGGGSNSGGGGGAKLFLQPVYSWPDQRQPQPQLQQPGTMVNADGEQRRPSQDMPIVIPMFDTLFTPCRATMPSPEQQQKLAVTSDFGFESAAAAAAAAGSSSHAFEFGPVYNIPPPPETFAPPLQVPMAPLRQPSGGRFGLYSPGSGEMAFQQYSQHQQSSTDNHQFKYVANSDFVRGASSAVAAPGSPLTLTGADAHASQEYDDERHEFLRRQEMTLFVGPGYLSRGEGVVMTTTAGAAVVGICPAERASAVDWLSKLHAAAPAASGVSEQLSLETLFLAVNLMDRFLSTDQGARVVFGGGGGVCGGPRPTLKLAAAACLALASKYQDTQAASLWGVAAAAAGAASSSSSASGSFSLSSSTATTSVHSSNGGGIGNNGNDDGGGDFFRVLGLTSGGGGGGGDNGDNVDVGAARKELVATETKVASALGFRLTVPTALSFLGVFLRRADALGYLQQQQDGTGGANHRVREEAQQILLCMLRESCSLEHYPSSLAACALYWASCVTSPGSAPPSSFAFLAVTGYELEQLCRCLRDMESVRTGGGVGDGRHGSGSFYASSASSSLLAGGGDWAGAAFPEHAGKSLFGAGGGHPAIAAL